jgi:solute:Na+ symporter, SSS family
VLSLAGKWFVPDFPFMNRMLVVFLVTLALAVIVSLMLPARTDQNRTVTADVDYRTSAGFNIAGLGVILILIALYATWW